MDLKETEILGDQVHSHWYYRAKAAAMARMLNGTAPGELLDVGAGSGYFARYLLDNTHSTGAICVDPNYAAEHEGDQHGKPIRFIRGIDHFRGTLVLMMDVLEHVPDDAALLADYVARVQPGTRFLLTVPAMQWMWSRHDVFLQHYRRYSLRQVDRLIAGAGLHRLASSYYYGLTLPLAASVRLGRRLVSGRTVAAKSDMTALPRPLNALLWQICRAEVPLFGFNRLAGLSVFALAVKQGRVAIPVSA